MQSDESGVSPGVLHKQDRCVQGIGEGLYDQLHRTIRKWAFLHSNQQGNGLLLTVQQLRQAPELAAGGLMQHQAVRHVIRQTDEAIEHLVRRVGQDHDGVNYQTLRQLALTESLDDDFPPTSDPDVAVAAEAAGGVPQESASCPAPC